MSLKSSSAALWARAPLVGARRFAVAIDEIACDEDEFSCLRHKTLSLDARETLQGDIKPSTLLRSGDRIDVYSPMAAEKDAQ